MGGCPGWILLAGSDYFVHAEHDLALIRRMYNKYKKCKKHDAFKSAVDALFVTGTFRVKRPATYMKDMESIQKTFEQLGSFSCAKASVQVAFRACSFPCVQLSVRAAFRACSFPCLQLSV
jgi:hypothetical protein